MIKTERLILKPLTYDQLVKYIKCDNSLEAEFEQDATILELTNKLNAIRFEINSLREQVQIIREIVIDYETLVSAEERKFSLGESSLFLINTREQKLIDARLKENNLFTKRLKSYVSYFNVLGLADITLN